MTRSTIAPHWPRIARALKTAAPEILIIVAIAVQASLFPDYIPTTNDDLQFATLGIPGDLWYWHNRPYFLVSGLFSGFATGAAFETRSVYGLHIAAFYAPLIAIYLYLIAVSKRHIGLFAFVAAFSFQVFGYNHATPLAYPFTTSLSLAGAAAAGLFGGRAVQRQDNFLKISACALLGIVSSSFYEPMALVSSILFGFSYISTPSPVRTGSLRKRILAVFLGLLPVAYIVFSKLAMAIVNKTLPDVFFPSGVFDTYDGAELSLASPLLSLRLAANDLVGSTILPHFRHSNTWPPVKRYPGAPVFLTVSFVLLVAAIAVASFQVFVAEYNESRCTAIAKNGYSYQTITLLLAVSLFAATACLVLPTSFSTKYLSWLVLSDYSWRYTYLTGSLSTILGAATASSLFSLFITHQYSLRGRKRASSLALGVLAIVLIASAGSFNHNYFVSTVIRDNVAALGEFADRCRLDYDDALLWVKSLDSNQFTGFPLHEHFCSTLSNDPSLYPNWQADAALITGSQSPPR